MGNSEAGSGFYSWKNLEYGFKMWPFRTYEESVPYPVIFVQTNSTSIYYFLSTLDRMVGSWAWDTIRSFK